MLEYDSMNSKLLLGIVLATFSVVMALLLLSFGLFDAEKLFGSDKISKNSLIIISPSFPLNITEKVKKTAEIKTPPPSYVLNQSNFIAQTFNNCGPASLSMVLSMFGTYISQDELGREMRPFSNPAGGNDDKSIFANEFVTYAEKQGFSALHRPNGTPEILKKFVANDIPVVVRTFLSPTEDIGHFRIVRGYDDTRGVLIQDDSYQGPNLEYTYADFDAMWQPFNYGYIVVYPKDKQDVVEAILGEEIDEKVAYENAINRANQELAQNPNSYYATFNLAVANYHLENYDLAAKQYEQIEYQLPPRMLWYQLEPYEIFMKTGNYDKVWSMTDIILNGGNQAFSELYYMRGEILEARGDAVGARGQYELAVYYNQNFQKAKDKLSTL